MSSVTEPHLHLSPMIAPILVASTSQTPQHISLTDMHIPTGHIRLEDVVRVLIEDFKVRPLRSDWTDVLARNAALIPAD